MRAHLSPSLTPEGSCLLWLLISGKPDIQLADPPGYLKHTGYITSSLFEIPGIASASLKHTIKAKGYTSYTLCPEVHNIRNLRS